MTVGSVKSNRIFLQSCKVTAFQLFLGCKNHHGSVTPNRMATETLRKPKMAKTAKKLHFRSQFAVSEGLTEPKSFASAFLYTI